MMIGMYMAHNNDSTLAMIVTFRPARSSWVSSAAGLMYALYTSMTNALDVQSRIESAEERKAQFYEQEIKRLGGISKHTLDDMLGHSKAISAVKRLASHVAQGKSTILIRCESGTGKEILAHAVHNASPRSQTPFRVKRAGSNRPTGGRSFSTRSATCPRRCRPRYSASCRSASCPSIYRSACECTRPSPSRPSAASWSR